MKAKDLKDFFNSLTEEQLKNEVFINCVDVGIKEVGHAEVIKDVYVKTPYCVELLSEQTDEDEHTECPKEWNIGNIHLTCY